MDEKRILIAVPSMDYVASGFAASLAMLQKTGNCMVSFICGSLIYDARNKLAGQALQLESTHVLWLDSDMVFKPDTLLKLVQTMDERNADIVSGLYFRRSAPYTPVAFSHIDIFEDNSSEHTDYTGELNGIHEVDAVGFGCVLMKTDVIAEVVAEFGMLFDPIGHFGEDLSFCWRAKKIGKKILLNTDIKCGHIGHITVNQSFFKAWQEGHPNESNI